MKAKLIKTEDEQGVMYSLSGDNLPENYVLSKQNCDEIFGVVDVYSQVEDIVKTICPDDRGKDVIYGTGMSVGIQCFNKAMELNKDKVFTEDDIRKVVNYMFEQTVVFSNKVSALDVDRYIQSLQQPTEIEVEIVEQCLDPTCDGINRKGECVTTGKPKYDTDGCLILKIK
jgi:hypothetical protein